MFPRSSEKQYCMLALGVGAARSGWGVTRKCPLFFLAYEKFGFGFVWCEYIIRCDILFYVLIDNWKIIPHTNYKLNLQQ